MIYCGCKKPSWKSEQRPVLITKNNIASNYSVCINRPESAQLMLDGEIQLDIKGSKRFDTLRTINNLEIYKTSRIRMLTLFQEAPEIYTDLF